MTITISPLTEQLLKKRAIEQGASEDELADSILFRELTDSDLDDGRAMNDTASLERLRNDIAHGIDQLERGDFATYTSGEEVAKEVISNGRAALAARASNSRP